MSNSTELHIEENHDHEHEDYVGDKMGMWLFLFTELLLFGGMFLAFLVYYISFYTEDFHNAGKNLNVMMGGGNTLILLTSSLTMVLAITAIQKKNKFLSIFYLIVTIACAGGFMVVKYFEWGAKFSHGLYPAKLTSLAEYFGPSIIPSLPKGEAIFFGLYFTMTGLHGFHVMAGVAVLLIVLYKVIVNDIDSEKFGYMENVGLYWHVVDLIWIYLFPLLYLVA
ncbi:MAG: cytochrome c oxidase subunit 3 [Candidatus Cloacimonetes bacterium]|nr:cytochrome c oxidase subunit 3 [Candidatus Cloacimonadota bacterium]